MRRQMDKLTLDEAVGFLGWFVYNRIDPMTTYMVLNHYYKVTGKIKGKKRENREVCQKAAQIFAHDKILSKERETRKMVRLATRYLKMMRTSFAQAERFDNSLN